VIETYRMLGKQREEELLREARRLQAGQAAKGSSRRPRLRQLEILAAGRRRFLWSVRRRRARAAATATRP
jgi:hypothetical protein